MFYTKCTKNEGRFLAEMFLSAQLTGLATRFLRFALKAHFKFRVQSLLNSLTKSE